jgi:hypothetical protein
LPQVWRPHSGAPWLDYKWRGLLLETVPLYWPVAVPGGMAEWLKAHAWKACIRETVSWVRIPLPPPRLCSRLFADDRNYPHNALNKPDFPAKVTFVAVRLRPPQFGILLWNLLWVKADTFGEADTFAGLGFEPTGRPLWV